MAFNLLAILSGFNLSKLHMVPYFSIIFVRLFVSISVSINNNTTDSFIISIFSSMYVATLSAIVLLLFFAVVLVFLKSPEFFTIISFLSYPKAGV